MNKAIETIYDGVKYRSKNEAKWAMFHNLCLIKNCYEIISQGFDGWNNLKYKPDFYFPEYGLYAEVKSTDKQLFDEDMSWKINGAIDYEATAVSNGLLLLGSFPYDVRIVEGLCLQTDILYWHKGVVSGTATYYEDENGKIKIYVQKNCKDSGSPLPASASCIIKLLQRGEHRGTAIYDAIRTVNEHFR